MKIFRGRQFNNEWGPGISKSCENGIPRSERGTVSLIFSRRSNIPIKRAELIIFESQISQKFKTVLLFIIVESPLKSNIIIKTLFYKKRPGKISLIQGKSNLSRVKTETKIRRK
ncbi:hypothetical protein ABEB36_006997 [Hypothenemus hampei]|uniref:Uncharacterized protein n=1 Tax=Hypothenemus hampei TaxID=57062 RepID=A0ABD1EUP7_HYPHA